MKQEHKLDNPVWNSLCETHQKFALTYNETKFYNPEYCPFGGFTDSESTLIAANKYTASCDSFFIVGEKPKIEAPLKIAKELVCLQMIISEKTQIPIDNEIIELNEKHFDELLYLVNLVQPGYFQPKTALLGSYFGIFKDGKLVSAAGERMKMDGFTEVSSIITHPNHTGKGYAKQLTAHVVNKIFDEEKIPFLHVVKSNAGAIQLYEKLGFTTRREMIFWNISK